MADFISPAWAMPTSGPFRGLMVISALWRCFSTARVTLPSNLSPRILRILARPVSTDLRRVGVISHFLAVNSTFISAPFLLDGPGFGTEEAVPFPLLYFISSLDVGGCWVFACLRGIL